MDIYAFIVLQLLMIYKIEIVGHLKHIYIYIYIYHSSAYFILFFKTLIQHECNSYLLILDSNLL
jgi:hypothetical protein